MAKRQQRNEAPTADELMEEMHITDKVTKKQTRYSMDLLVLAVLFFVAVLLGLLWLITWLGQHVWRLWFG